MENLGEYEYSKKDLIGHGAFAVVFKGRYTKRTELPVAIKCVTKKQLAKSQALLSKEIKILKELSGLQHENVVGLLDCKETNQHLYLVMEYCNGGDLADYLQINQTLSEDTIAMFLSQIAAAMKALFGMGIVHRDLKPQNLLLHYVVKNPKSSDIQIKIADFGFARFLQDGVMAATLCGSPMYMAPEVIMSHHYDAKADLWSIGTIVYQCLTGKAPFQASTPQQLKNFYEKNPGLKPNIPQGTSSLLRDLLYRLLKRNSSDRIEFPSFFNHPFVTKFAKPVTPPQKSSSPVAVPNRSDQTDDSSPYSENSPNSLRAVSVSPLSAVKAGHLQRDGYNSPTSSPNYKPQTTRRPSRPTSGANQEVGNDYVMVPNASEQTPVQMRPQKPSNLTVTSPDKPTSTSKPVPVPSRRNQQATGPQKYSGSPAQSAVCVRSGSPGSDKRSRCNSTSSVPGLDIGSFTPPKLTFTGTPPSTTYKAIGRVRSNTETSSLAGSPGDNRRPSFVEQDNKENQTRRYSNMELSSPSSLPYAPSPPHMEGPVMMVAPGLSDETLMNSEHINTLNRLHYITKLISCLTELAQTRTNPLLESRQANKLTGCVVFVSEKQRRLEQFVLYVRGLHILSASLQLARDEIGKGDLHPSQAVRQVIKELNQYYHTCFDKCKLLKSRGIDTNGVEQTFLNNSADKLIYEHAIEQCQLAALDELMQHPIECVKRYSCAQILLHSLVQTADLDSDKDLLNTYKSEVEKRLLNLEKQGYCQSNHVKIS